VRVVSGRLGGRRLIAPDGRDTRPTTDRVREAVFNALGSAGLIQDALVADLYAGSGAIGIEALSRGAAHCVFVERDRSALNALESNIRALGIDEISAVRRSAVAGVVGSLDVDLVFADPPYGEVDWADLLGQIAAPFVVAEDDHEVRPPEGWHTVRARRYGRTWVTFLERRPSATSESAGGELS
jgi:16S rRNA (guanine966-N2)-methyltransferase